MKKSIIILHGWGLCGEKYNELSKLLINKGYKVFAPDAPGFGSEPLNKTMNLDDYVDFLDKFIKKNKIEKPILIGHSFGGRIASKFAWRYPQQVDKIILTGTPIFREKSFTKKIFFVLAAFGGSLLKKAPSKIQNFFRKSLYFMIGEWDYYKSGSLKQVFKNIIEEEIYPYLKEIKVPVFLVWGEDDIIVPFSTVKENKGKLSNCKIIPVPGTNHKLPYLNYELFFKNIEKYL